MMTTFGVGVVEGLPERLGGKSSPCLPPELKSGYENRQGEATDARQDRREAFFFTRPGLQPPTSAHSLFKHDDVPRDEFIAVETVFGIAGRRTKIPEIKGCASRSELVIARRGRVRSFTRPRFCCSNQSLLLCHRISEVADGHDRAGNFSELRLRLEGRASYVACTDGEPADAVG